MNDDLISRQAAIDALVDAFIEDGEELAESVKVVQCKECQYRKKVGTSYYCELDEFNVKDTDFCSWGERRINECK